MFFEVSLFFAEFTHHACLGAIALHASRSQTFPGDQGLAGHGTWRQGRFITRLLVMAWAGRGGWRHFSERMLGLRETRGRGSRTNTGHRLLTMPWLLVAGIHKPLSTIVAQAPARPLQQAGREEGVHRVFGCPAPPAGWPWQKKILHCEFHRRVQKIRSACGSARRPALQALSAYVGGPRHHWVASTVLDVPKCIHEGVHVARLLAQVLEQREERPEHGRLQDAPHHHHCLLQPAPGTLPQGLILFPDPGGCH